MIDFEHVWLPQIVSYARIISTGQLEDQWIERSHATTSITDPDELYEQIFDDLDSDSIWSEACRTRKLPKPEVDAINGFLVALREADGRDGMDFVLSDAWSKIREAANVVLAEVG